MAKRNSNAAIDDIVAHLDGVVGAVRKTTEKIAAKAEYRLNTIPKHRTGASQIVMEFGKTDGFVSLVDPAALSIEFGHISNRTGRFIPGMYIIIGASRDL